MSIHDDITYSSVPSRSYPVNYTDPVKLCPGKYARQVTFHTIPGQSGIYAKIPVPLSGTVNSIAISLKGQTHAGQVILTTADPTYDYTGAFLYAFAEGIAPASAGPPMYRAVGIRGAAYNTVGTDHQGAVFAVIIGGPTADNITADVNVVVK